MSAKIKRKNCEISIVMKTAHLLTTRTAVTQSLSRVMLQPRTQSEVLQWL
jgi:hypothetical protein